MAGPASRWADQLAITGHFPWTIGGRLSRPPAGRISWPLTSVSGLGVEAGDLPGTRRPLNERRSWMVAAPLLSQQRIAVAVHPFARGVQRVLQRARFPSHTYPFHQPIRGGVAAKQCAVTRRKPKSSKQSRSAPSTASVA